MKRLKHNVSERFTERSKAGVSFDVSFWKKAGVQARFSAMWKAVDEFYKIRGMNGSKPRLQRSVQNIEQI